MRFKRLFSDTFFMLLSEGLLKAFQLFVNILIARSLTVADFGLFSNVFAVTQIFSILSDYGMSVLLINECKKNVEDTKLIIAKYVPLKIVMSLFFIMVSIGIGVLDSSVPSELYALLTLYNVIQFGFLNMIYVNYRVNGDFKKEATTKFLNFFGQLIGLFFFYETQSLVMASLPYFLSAIIPFSVLLFTTKLYSHVSFKQFISRFKETLSHVLIPGTSQVLSTVFTVVPFVVLRIYADEYWVGIFSASFKLLLPFLMLSTIVTTVFVPRIDMLTDKIKIVRKLALLFIAALLAFSVLLLPLISEDLITLVYGNLYIKSAGSFVILFSLPFISFVSQMFGNYLLYKESYSYHMASSVIALTTLLILSIVLVPTSDSPHVTMAATLLLAEVVLALSRIYITRDRK